MAKVPNAVEILPKIWTAWVGRKNVTDDRQTDDRRTTDGRAIAYSEREREFTFAKNRQCQCVFVGVFLYDRTLRELFPAKRPLVLTRSNFAGTQKYAAHWLGDNQSRWPQMAWSIVGLFSWFYVKAFCSWACSLGFSIKLE